MASGDPCDVCGKPIPRGGGPRKRCSRECQQIFRRDYQRDYYADDPDRAIAYVAAYKARHPERVRDHIAKRPRPSYETTRANMLQAHYGLSVDQYDAMAQAQGGRCAICKRIETRVIRGRPAPLSVDHDHETGEVRGLLCGRCNSVLGFIESDLLAAATDYLRRHQSEREASS